MNQPKPFDIQWNVFASIETLITGTCGYNHFLEEVVSTAANHLGKNEKNIGDLAALFDDWIESDPARIMHEPCFIQKMRAYVNQLTEEECKHAFRWKNKKWKLNLLFREANAINNSFGSEILLNGMDLIIPWPLPARSTKYRTKLGNNVNSAISNYWLSEYESRPEYRSSEVLPIRSIFHVMDILLVLGHHDDKGNGVGDYIDRLNRTGVGQANKGQAKEIFLEFEEELQDKYKEWPPWSIYNLRNNNRFNVVAQKGRKSVNSKLRFDPAGGNMSTTLYIGLDYQPSECKTAHHIYTAAKDLSKSVVKPNDYNLLSLVEMNEAQEKRKKKREERIISLDDDSCMHYNAIGCCRDKELLPLWAKLILEEA